MVRVRFGKLWKNKRLQMTPIKNKPTILRLYAQNYATLYKKQT